MELRAQQCFGVQDTDRENKEHIGPDKTENKEQNIDNPQQQRIMKGPCFIQPVGDAFKQLCEDVDHQNGKESAVQTDRQPGPEKVVTHDDQQYQHAGDNKTVVHFPEIHPLPAKGSPFFFVVNDACETERLHKKSEQLHDSAEQIYHKLHEM